MRYLVVRKCGGLAHCHTARCVFHEADLRRLPCHACDLNHFLPMLGGSRPLSTRIRLEWRIFWWFCRDLRLMWRSTWQRTTRIRLKWPISWWFVEVCSSFGVRPRRNHQDPTLMADIWWFVMICNSCGVGMAENHQIPYDNSIEAVIAGQSPWTCCLIPVDKYLTSPPVVFYCIIHHPTSLSKPSTDRKLPAAASITRILTSRRTSSPPKQPCLPSTPTTPSNPTHP